MPVVQQGLNAIEGGREASGRGYLGFKLIPQLTEAIALRGWQETKHAIGGLLLSPGLIPMPGQVVAKGIASVDFHQVMDQ